ncbi:MAG: DNA-binding protein [Peptococcaceae bacterium BICA1-8]|nr:MAG: DNA-binding protein [Peptococcaceae bacterium BICA1-8]
MEKNDLIDFWVETAENDYCTMQNLYTSKDYHWSLFMGHLVIEKLLKALYIKNIDNNVPRIHDLLRLAEKAGIETTEEQKDDLDLITTFNIRARYPDYRKSFYKKCDFDFTTVNIEKIKELREWLLSMI